MQPLEVLGRVRTHDGKEMILYHRGGHFHIRIDGLELMSSRAHGSEEALARLARDRMVRSKAPRVLIGGLGMGYTLSSALRSFPPKARIVVVELFASVVEWNRGPLAHLAGHPLRDPRVEVEVGDVAHCLRSPSSYDAILLDVDNGPGGLTQESNHRLYTLRGLREIRRALTPGGVLAVWSPDASPGFAQTLRRAGLVSTRHEVSARGHARGPRHSVFLAWPLSQTPTLAPPRASRRRPKKKKKAVPRRGIRPYRHDEGDEGAGRAEHAE